MPPKKSKQIEEDQSREEVAKTIHEMISEALMGATSSGTDSRSSDAHFDTNSLTLTDQETQLLYNSLSGNEEESLLTLGGLYLKFQNLDFRLSRVESVIAKRDDFGGNAVKKRVTTLPRSRYPGPTDICYGSTSNHNVGSDSSSPVLAATINPILTSGTDMLGMGNFQGGTSSTYSRHGKIQRKDEIKRSELDHICLPLLEYSPKPTTEQLQEIVDSIAHAYPDIASKHLLSKVREWFRKRREYMSQRIFSVCAEVFQDVKIEAESELEAQISHLNQNEALVGIVLEKADLEIIDQIVAKEYCRDKILSYFNSLYKPSSLKNRTLQ